MRIETNAEKLKLNEQEIKDVSVFHRTLFLDVLRVANKCLVYDNEGDSNGYFIVPLKPSE